MKILWTACKKDEVYTVKVILQSIYWTYSWPCKQLKKDLISHLRPVQITISHSSRHCVFYVAKILRDEERRGWGRITYKRKKLKKKLACCFNRELRNCPLWENKKMISDQNIPFTFSTVTGFPPLSTLSVYYPQLLKVMLEIHTMSRCCCQSFAVYFFIPTRWKIYI